MSNRVPKSPGQAKSQLVVVVLVVLALLLAGVAVFVTVRNRIQEAAFGSRILKQTKSIALQMKMFAIDNDGIYPSDGMTTRGRTVARGADSTEIFQTLLIDGNYGLWPTAYWIPTFGTERPDDDPMRTPLGPGHNGYAYFHGLDDSSNPAHPLLMLAPVVADPMPRWDLSRSYTWGRAFRIQGKHKVPVCMVDYSAQQIELGPDGRFLPTFNPTAIFGKPGSIPMDLRLPTPLVP